MSARHRGKPPTQSRLSAELPEVEEPAVIADNLASHPHPWVVRLKEEGLESGPWFMFCLVHFAASAPPPPPRMCVCMCVSVCLSVNDQSIVLELNVVQLDVLG